MQSVMTSVLDLSHLVEVGNSPNSKMRGELDKLRGAKQRPVIIVPSEFVRGIAGYHIYLGHEQGYSEKIRTQDLAPRIRTDGYTLRVRDVPNDRIVRDINQFLAKLSPRDDFRIIPVVWGETHSFYAKQKGKPYIES